MNKNTLNDQASSILAVCLSQENIRVIHTRDEVASFDEINRILRLPTTKMSTDKNITIGLSLHEVGHALYTTPELRDLLTEKKISFNLVNIIEDVRIEKLIKRKYKGASRIMARSHMSLFKEGYFGSLEKIKKSGALSILNVYYKVGAASGLKLDPAFSEIYPLIDKMETVHDVIEVCELLKDKDEEIKQEKEDAKQEQENGLEETNEEKEDSKEFGEDDKESNESSEEESNESSEDESTQSKSENDEGDDEADISQNNSDPFDNDSDEKSEDDEETESNKPGDKFSDSLSNGLGEGDSQNDYDEKVKENIVDTDGYYDKVFYKNTTPSFKELKEKRVIVDVETFHAAIESAKLESFNGWKSQGYKEDYEKVTALYPEFLTDIKRTVNHMSNAFNRMKSASEWSRTKQHDKGTLNMRKLHQYKYNDHIFNKGQTIAKGKNHGIVMMIDYSGSMNGVISEELKQIIITAMFAKKVGIPFEAYSFTNNENDNKAENNYERSITPVISQLTFDDLAVVELINSSMKKRDFEKAIFNLFVTRFHHMSILKKSNRGYTYWERYNPYNPCSYERLSGTPLSASMLVIERVIGNFVKKHNVEIPTFICITDGAGSSMHTDYNENSKTAGIEDGNRFYEIPQKRDYYGGTNEVRLINNIIKQKYNANIIGYFIGQSNTCLKSGKRVYGIPEEIIVTKSTIKKKGFLAVEVESFDKFFFITGSQDDEQEYDTEKHDIKDIKKKFRANAKASTNSRVFVNEVITIVAKAA